MSSSQSILAMAAYLLWLPGGWLACAQAYSQFEVTTALTASPNGILDWCTSTGNTSDFTLWDEVVTLKYQVRGGRRGDVIRIEWIPAEGQAVIYRLPAAASDYGGCYAWVLGVLGTGVPLGDWRVRFFLNDIALSTLPFRLNAPPTAPFTYTVKKIPAVVPADTDMVALTIHNGGQILLATNSAEIRPFLTARGASISPGRTLDAISGIGSVVNGMDIRDSTLFGTTRAAGATLGFLKGETFTTYDYPGSAMTEVKGLWKVNNWLVGRFVRQDGTSHGFLHTGQYQLIEPPGAISSEANGINSLSQIAGSYVDALKIRRGFVWQRGVFSNLEYPGMNETRPAAINDGGVVAGSYLDNGGRQRAFVFHRGIYQTIEVPGATMSAATSINGSGQIVGVYREGNGPMRSFAAYLRERPMSFCEYSAIPPSGELPGGGGFLEMAIETSQGCPWVTGSDAAWLDISPVVGIGAGRARISARANTGSARRGNAFVWWLKFPISQRGAPGPPPAVTGIANGASFEAGIPAGGWFVIQGTNLSAVSRIWSSADIAGNRLPTALDGISVKIGNLDAYPYYISPTQLNLLAPQGAPEGETAITVAGPEGMARIQATVRRFQPAFFAVGPVRDGLAPAAAVHSDGAFVAGVGSIPGATARPAKPGDAVMIFGTGFGGTRPEIPAGVAASPPAALANEAIVFVGGQRAVVDYAGVVGPGLVQINLRIPEFLPPGRHSIVASIGGVESPPVVGIAVE
jgi:uncharacterized protein (TIGR03437 family)